MLSLARRKFLALAAAYGASVAWRTRSSHASSISREERRELFPQGVGSGDPHSDSVILWTRRPPLAGNSARALTVEIAEDRTFDRVVASAETSVSEETDWTCRVLAADLKPARVYWYRFSDEHGFGGRIGRT